MHPRRMWPFYESLIRKMAGVGTIPTKHDTEKYQDSYMFHRLNNFDRILYLDPKNSTKPRTTMATT